MRSRMLVMYCLVACLPVQLSVAQTKSVTISGLVGSNTDKKPLPYVNVILTTVTDSSFVAGTITDEKGRYSLPAVVAGNYRQTFSYTGYNSHIQPLFVGTLSDFLEIPIIYLSASDTALQGVTVTARTSEISNRLDKKTFSVSENTSQLGGSVLQAMQNLPGIVVQDGKVQLRGSDKVTILIDGKQTAMTGFGSQTGLDNLPASAIDKIEIINNPSSKYDANGNAGIINIILKKNRQSGWSGKAGLSAGLGSLWIRQQNLPSIRPQYRFTPKVNPKLSLNYRKNSINAFLQADYLYTETLNKNEFVTRNYDDGTVIQSQLKRNRNTHFLTTRAGLDWNIDSRNSLTLSGMYGMEKIIDRGDQPFFNSDKSERLRLWQFLEDELKTTVMGTAAYQHKFSQPGRLFNLGFNYTFHREDEKYFYDNYLPDSRGTDAFKLLSDEQVYDLNADYIQPLRYGRLETGVKIRRRVIPTNMQFIPGAHSVIDSSAGGWADYKEWIPALYGNYIFEKEHWETEWGLRVEYVHLQYDVNPQHPTYSSSGYHYTQPFPSFRFGYKLNGSNKLSVFYNRRVDRPNEVDIRIFPKYDDAEIIKVGNPALRPQFTNSFELGHKYSWAGGYLYSALYHRFANGTITRISSVVPGSNLIYAVFQNAGRSRNSGAEITWNQQVNNWYTFTLNGNVYRNTIDAFTVINLYPQPNTFSADRQSAVSGNVKWNNQFRFSRGLNGQLSLVYLAPDIIPQGRIASRFSVDLGLKKNVQKGRGELFVNATDLFNTMVIKRQIQGMTFHYTSTDYYETQVVRAGYTYTF